MRIIGGEFKGRIFNPNKKFAARPTTDIAKEGLFNILDNRYDFYSKTALDLFSGTGSIGYEFVSRGCIEVTFVENNYNHFSYINSVIKTLNITNARVFKTDVFRFIEKNKKSFDFVFADPPFDFAQIDTIPSAIFQSEILNETGVFILEHPKAQSFIKHPYFKELRSYGKVQFSFFGW